MGVLPGILFLLVGFCLGSFINAVIIRWSKGRAVKLKKVLGINKKWWRSFCDNCQRKLLWWENIPLVSFLVLKGRCRTCHSPIPYWYFFSELITGIAFLLTYFYWSKNFLGHGLPISNYAMLLVYLLITTLLVFIFFYDACYQIIPDWAVLILIVLIFLTNFKNLGVALGAAGLFLFLHLLTRGRGMGIGDVKFAFFMGLFLGFPKIIFAFYLAFLTGALWGVILILRKKKKIGQQIAFGPFLVLGTFISWFWGDRFLDFFYQWFG